MKVYRLLVLFTLQAVLLSQCNRARTIISQESLSSDTLSIAHGLILTGQGEVIDPKPDHLLEVLSTIQDRVSDSISDRAAGVLQIIESNVADPIFKKAITIDVLLEESDALEKSKYQSLNALVRSYYALSIMNQTDLESSKHQWLKGLSPAVSNALRSVGVNVDGNYFFGDRDYIEDCRSQGVPIPEILFDDNWQFLGNVSPILAATNSRKSELWMQVNRNNPRGFCLALKRFLRGNRGFVDLICFGVYSDKACFFETPLEFITGSGSPPLVDLGGTMSINELHGPDDIGVAANCLKCHIGANPFIVHPNQQAFVNAYDKKDRTLGGGRNLNGRSWYKPIVPRSWPINPPPVVLSTYQSSPKRCTTCHSLGTQAGAFAYPRNVDSNFTGQYSPYCGQNVLEGVLDPQYRLMPLNDYQNIQSYLAEISQLKDICHAHSENFQIGPAKVELGGFAKGISDARNTLAVIANRGNRNFAVEKVTFHGPGSQDFYFLGPPTPFVVAPGESTGLYAEFIPNRVGRYSIDMRVQMAKSRKTIPIEVNVLPPDPYIHIAPHALDFGSILEGTSREKRLVIQNIGYGDLQWNIPEAPGADFKWASNLSQQDILTPGDSKIISVTYSPNSLGEQISQFTIVSNDRDVIVKFRGIAHEPPKPNILVGSHMNITGLWQQTVSGNLLIRNTGASDLVIDNVMFLGSSSFGTNTNLPLTIESGGTSQLVIQRLSSTTEHERGTIVILSNAEESPSTVSLFSATAYPISLLVAPASGELDFGEFSNADPLQKRPIRVFNVGSYRMELYSVIVDQLNSLGSPIEVYEIVSALVVEGGNSQGTVPVFNPTSLGLVTLEPGAFVDIEIAAVAKGFVGQANGSLMIYTNTPEDPQKSLVLNAKVN